MGSEWIEVTDPAALAGALSADLDHQSENLYAAVMRIPGSERWWRTSTEVVDGTQGTSLGLQLLKTRVFFNLTEARKLWGDAAVVGTVFLLSSSLPLAGAVALVKKLVENLNLLTEDEAEAVRVIMGLAGPRPYETSVPEAAVRAAFAEATINIGAVLDSLETKKLLRSERGDTVRLVF